MQSTNSTGVQRLVLWVVGLGLLVGGLVLVVVTIKANYAADLSSDGGSMWDFRDAGFYPVRAVLDGVNPYDVDRYLAMYPVGQEFPLLPPTYMVLHAPFQLLELGPASVGMFLISLVGIVLLSAWSLRISRYRITPLAVVLVSGLLLVSNGGRNVLFTGQSSLVFIAGMYLALTASGVAQGSVGVFIALIKPGFGLPFAVLVAAAGKYRRAVIGAVVAAAVSAILMVPFVVWEGGVGDLLEILRDNVSFSASSRWVSLETTTVRIDVAATIALIFDVVPSNLTVILIGLAVVGGASAVLVLKRTALAHGTAYDAAIVLVCLGTLIGIYHGFYDLGLLLLPTILVTRVDFAGGFPARALRLALLLSLLVASFNPFRIDTIGRMLPGSSRVADVLATGLTGVSLIVAFGIALLIVWQLPEQGANHIASDQGD